MKTKKNVKAKVDAKKIIVEQIEAIKSEHYKLDAILRSCWKSKNAAKSISAKPLLLWMRGRVKSLVDNLRRSGSDVCAKIIEDDFEVVIQRLEAGVTNMQELLILQGLVRDFGRTLTDTQEYFAEVPGDGDTEKQGRPEVQKATEIILNKYPEFKKKLKKGQLVSLSEHVNKLLKSWGQKPVKKGSVKNAKSEILKKPS